jgi:hypothetical protein
MIAAITLKMLDPFRTGKLVLFQVTYDRVLPSTHSVPNRNLLTVHLGLARLGARSFLVDQHHLCQ